MTSTELFLSYRDYRLTLPYSGLPDCCRLDPHPYEHFLTAWLASQRTPANPAAPYTHTPATL